MIKFFLACFFIFSSPILSQELKDFNPSSIKISEIEKKKIIFIRFKRELSNIGI